MQDDIAVEVEKPSRSKGDAEDDGGEVGAGTEVAAAAVAASPGEDERRRKAGTRKGRERVERRVEGKERKRTVNPCFTFGENFKF